MEPSGDGESSSESISQPASSGAESISESSSQPASDAAAREAKQLEMQRSVVYIDCFLIFRALCKLSVTEIPKGFADPTSLDMRSKILSLELLLSILEEATPAMRSHKKFVSQAIKKYLCISLLTNGVSPIPKIFQLSLSIFWTLLNFFKQNLKAEIGIFFKKIFLPLLESPHSTVQQKWMVLQVLLKICRTPQTLLELFVNYDCSSDPNNLVFEPMVRDIAAIAKGSPTVDNWTTPAQDAKMRTMGLECLVAIARSLVSWSNELMGEAHDEHIHASLVAAGAAAAAATTTATATTDAAAANARSSLRSGTDEVRSGDERSGEDDHVDGAAQPAAGLLAATSDSTVVLKVDPIEEQLRHNQQLRRGFELFNRKPSRGIDFLVKLGHITSEPASIAQLLRAEKSLERSSVGDYLGGHQANNVAVMHAYVDLFHFKGLTLDAAIRSFLLEFRLPGEARQIDRIMEKFAARYYEQNMDCPHFANATSAYVMAFAVIMLATDLHSAAIPKERKMTKESFRKMLRGQNENVDFPPELLDATYDRIAAEPLQVNQDEKASHRNSGSFLTAKTRLQLFHQETREMVKKSRAELRENLVAEEMAYFVAPEVHHVRPIFEVSWGAMLAAFGQLLESSEDPNAINLCLEGFRLAIRIAGIFYLDTPRTSCINALKKFTLLDPTMVRRHRLKRKNVDTIVTLLELALTDGNYFQNSWGIILECISQLDRLATLTAFGIHSDTELQSPEPTIGHDRAPKNSATTTTTTTTTATTTVAAGRPAKPAEKRPASTMAPGSSSGAGSGEADENAASLLPSYFGTETPAERQRREAELAASIEATNAATIAAQIDFKLIDKIFSHTVKLNGDAIVDFVQGLCDVSLREIASAKGPRLFSLRKIVEVASFNMDRIRLIWSRVWSYLSVHFERVGCDENSSVAMYAVDSLRQLAMKFLEKDELANFSFQQLFLKPFEYISQNTSSLVIRELIIRCLSQMVLARSHNLMSGWKCILSVLSAESGQQEASIVQLAFELAKAIATEYFRYIAEHGFFQDCVRMLIAYGNSTLIPAVALQATSLLGECAQHLIKGEIVPSGDDFEPMGTWFPTLTGLAGIASHPTVDVRLRSLRTLFAVLNQAGGRFSPRDWDVLCRGVILPIFDNVRYAGDSPDFAAAASEENEWVASTCRPALTYFISIFSWFFDSVAFLLDECLCLLTACILQENEPLATIGCSVFTQLVVTNRTKWTPAMWDQILFAFDFMLQKNTPREILSLTKLQREQSNGAAASPGDAAASESPPSDGVPFPPVEPATLASELEAFSLRLSRTVPLGLHREEQRSALLFMKMIRCRCQVQAMLVASIAEILEVSDTQLEQPHFMFLLTTLQRAFDFSRSVNNNDVLWKLIAKTNLQPDFIKQELDACYQYLGLLFRLFSPAVSTPRTLAMIGAVEARLVGTCEAILADFARTLGTDLVQHPYTKSKLSIVIHILTEIYHFTDEAFARHLATFYAQFAQLICATSRKVRKLLTAIFLRVGALQHIITPPSVVDQQVGQIADNDE